MRDTPRLVGTIRMGLAGIVMGATVAMANPAIQWEKRASLPTARLYFSTAVGDDGLIYAIGGEWRAGGGDTSVLEAYNPINNIWYQRTPTPYKSFWATATKGIDGKIYVFGLGEEPGTRIRVSTQIYDPVSDSWSTGSKPSYEADGFYDAAAVTLQDGRILVIGGRTDGGPVRNYIRVYYPDQDNWGLAGGLATARRRLKAVVHNGRLYCIGGYDSDGVALNSMEVFEVDNPDGYIVAVPEAIAPMNQARADFGLIAGKCSFFALGGFNGAVLSTNEIGTTSDDMIYVVGGTDATYDYFNYSPPWFDTVEAYDIANNTWSYVTNNLPTARRGLACVGLARRNSLSDFLTTAPDINSNSFSEVAVLQKDNITGNDFVHIKDSHYTDVLINSIDFGPALYDYTAPVIVPDIDGNGISEVALLGADEATGKLLATIKDMQSGTLVKSLGFGNMDLIKHAIVSDVNGNGISEVAVLGVNKATWQVCVTIKDAKTGTLVKNVPFGKDSTPIGLEILPDIDGNGISEVAVLGVNKATWQVCVTIKDAKTGTLVKNVPFGKDSTPIDLEILPDIDGNGIPEVALLGVNKTTWRVYVIIKDAKTGTLVKNMGLGIYTPKGIGVVPDINGNGVSEVAVLKVDSTDLVLVTIKDAKTGAVVGNISFGRTSTPIGLSILPDINGNNIPEIAVLLVNKTTGDVKVALKDINTPILDIPIP